MQSDEISITLIYNTTHRTLRVDTSVVPGGKKFEEVLTPNLPEGRHPPLLRVHFHQMNPCYLYWVSGGRQYRIEVPC